MRRDAERVLAPYLGSQEGPDLLARIPILPEICTSGDSGSPIAASAALYLARTGGDALLLGEAWGAWSGVSAAEPFPARFSLSDFTSSDGVMLDGRGELNSVGVSVRYAGDFNGDGIDDLIVGGGSASNGDEAFAGVAYVVYGNESPAP